VRAQYIPPRQFGAAKTALSPDDAALLARMQTDRQARAVLGVVAQYLRKGYEVAQTVPSFISPIDGTKAAAAAMRVGLDQINNYAQRVYNAIPNDDAPVSDLNRKKVGLSLAQARTELAIVSTDANDLNQGLTGALLELFNDMFKRLAHDAVQDPLKALKWVGVGVVALVGLFTVGKLVHTVALGGAMDEELHVAEREALRIARSRKLKSKPA
jgi:hypothetical protein